MSKGTRAVNAMLKHERAIAGLGILLASTITEIAPTVSTIVVSRRVELAVGLELKSRYRVDAAAAGFELWADSRLRENEIRLLDPNGRVIGVLALAK